MVTINGLSICAFRFARDKWNSQEFNLFKSGILTHDKIQHGFFSLLATILILIISPFLRFTLLNSDLSILIAVLLLGFIWEIKDGFIPDQEPNYIIIGKFKYCFGGDGFSFKDLTANTIGVLLGYFIYNLFTGFVRWIPQVL